MRRATLIASLGIGALLALAKCSSSAPCENLVHSACSLSDGGATCANGAVCVAVDYAIDPCEPGASACCFQACTTDSQCPSGQLCTLDGTGSVCALGRCATDDGGD